jgi:hypothetical protein
VVSLGRNDPCHCGSGKKYKRCHLDLDREAERALADALPAILEKNAIYAATQQRLRDEFGVHIDYVSPTQWQGGKVWALGNRVYTNQPANQTFHEFVIMVLRDTLENGGWATRQSELPHAQRHFVYTCNEKYEEWKHANADPQEFERTARYSAHPNGWVQYLISLAWDVATLVQARARDLPAALVDRLRDPAAFQGARYEVAIAAVFARLDCDIRLLDDEPELRREKHVEFVATYRPTGQEIAVEVKSRHRPGVLHESGDPDEDDPLRGDARAVRRLFRNAIDKAPDLIPYIVFIDINAPLNVEGLDQRWQQGVQAWMNRLPQPTPEEPDAFNAFYVTNFSPHYEGDDDITRRGHWMAVHPKYVRHPLAFDLIGDLQLALDNYGRVPSFAEDGVLLR